MSWFLDWIDPANKAAPLVKASLHKRGAVIVEGAPAACPPCESSGVHPVVVGAAVAGVALAAITVGYAYGTISERYGYAK